MWANTQFSAYSFMFIKETESANGGVLSKRMFLKVSQISQKNKSIDVSF